MVRSAGVKRSCAATSASLARGESGGTRLAGSMELRRPECIRSTIARRPARMLSSPPQQGPSKCQAFPSAQHSPGALGPANGSDRIGGSWLAHGGLSVRWCRGQVAGTSTPISHQASAGAREPGQHLSVADRRDREQSALAEGKERSTSVALSPGQLRGTAGRHRRSARGDRWGTDTRRDCWGVRLSGGTPRFKNRPEGESALGCGLLAGAEQVRAVAPGPAPP